MGQIIKKETLPSGKIIIHLELKEKDAQKLKGHYKKIHLFSEDLCLHNTKLIERGTNKSAKYVSIPLILKERKHPKLSEVKYQKIETDSKIFYIAVVKEEKRSE
jgi:hypothetical protein